MALVVPPPNDRKRVKVYELRNNDWFDRGTGFCMGQVANDEPKIVVESEEQPIRILLETKISRDGGYQKQQDTLIIWNEVNGPEMALSFQEADGCAAIWLVDIKSKSRLAALWEQNRPDDALSDDAMDSFSNPILLPPPELASLAEIDTAMRMASTSPAGRDALSKFIIGEDYIQKLVPLVELAEKMHALTELHRLSNIMKLLILLNDTQIIEIVVSDEVILGVVGALEYDQDFPNHKANHRQFLKDRSRFKEVVPIEDEVTKKKIHSTWRLQYLKDVVLARILDDPTFSVLNSLIFFNQVDIVTHIQQNSVFLKDLFRVINSPETELRQKKDAVCFIQQCCAIAKNLQAPGRVNLYSNFIQNGLLDVITFALLHKDASIRIAGTDILVAMIDHDPSLMRKYIFGPPGAQKTPLTDTLIELLLLEVDMGVKAQAADAIKVLLDPSNNPQGQENISKAGPEAMLKGRPLQPQNGQNEIFIQNFYAEAAKKLFKPLKDLEQQDSLQTLTLSETILYVYLVEILNFFIRQHSQHCRKFIEEQGLAARIAQLLSCPQKYLKLTALKFFRTAISLQEKFYNEQIMDNKLFEPILDIVYSTMPRDNLLNSACLELFEFIKRDSIKPIIIHLVENYRDKLQDITYVDTFQFLVLRYDQIQGYAPDMEPGLFGSEEDRASVMRTTINGNNRRWQSFKDTDPEEEQYFNTSDDEDELATAKPMLGTENPLTNGSPQPFKPLVDYPDDDEEPMTDMKARPPNTNSSLKAQTQTAVSDTRGKDSFSQSFVENPLSNTSSSPPTTRSTAQYINSLLSQPTPLERLSEKRRREEDEEDELGKLSFSSKRRSSSASSTTNHSSALGNSSNANASHATQAQNVHSHERNSSNTTSFLRRKKSFSGKESSGTARKIAISLGIKSAPVEASGEHSGPGGG
ncbi:MAG: Platinum sensitivity protein [Icmadophila ericetorum]|nr:Platinum sensitivity protein [Icmadophila ericetorum]